MEVPAFTSYSKCAEYEDGGHGVLAHFGSWCKRWLEPVMLPPPIWSPTFAFQGLAQGIDTKLVETMEIENVASTK